MNILNRATITDAVETRSRLTGADVVSLFGIDTAVYPLTLVDLWLLSAKQSADRYLNHPFIDYAAIPEPVEQGILAYISVMFKAYVAEFGNPADGATVITRGVSSTSVGDQSVTYTSASEMHSQIAGYYYQRSGWGEANMAGQQFWSVYRLYTL